MDDMEHLGQQIAQRTREIAEQHVQALLHPEAVTIEKSAPQVSWAFLRHVVDIREPDMDPLSIGKSQPVYTEIGSPPFTIPEVDLSAFSDIAKAAQPEPAPAGNPVPTEAGMQFFGTWQSGKRYPKGATVVVPGAGLFVATKATRAAPISDSGQRSPDWTQITGAMAGGFTSTGLVDRVANQMVAEVVVGDTAPDPAPQKNGQHRVWHRTVDHRTLFSTTDAGGNWVWVMQAVSPP